MISTTLNATSASHRQAARGAPFGASFALRARAIGRALLRAGTPRRRTATEEAAAVREMARRVQHSEPGFASDLLAAADRHERLADGAR